MKTKSKITQLQSVSFIIPAMNEEETLETLFNGIADQMESLGYEWEVLFIDDGSTDNSWNEMTRLAQLHPDHVRSFRFRRNLGKADALALGYQEATGDVIFTMDADLQDDPNEIPRFLDKLSEGYGIVTGWKRKRFDPWHKVLPSRVFNAVLSRLVGVPLHDHNCGFKAYRREVAKILPMYGEMHRMVPSLASFEGYRTAEIVVQHHARQFGESKYGVKRILCGIFDMTTVSFLKTYRNRPMHFFGRLALASGALSGVLWTAAIALAILGGAATLPAMAGTLTALAAVLFVGQGLQLEHGVYRQMKEGRSLPVSSVVEGRQPSSKVVFEEAGSVTSLAH